MSIADPAFRGIPAAPLRPFEESVEAVVVDRALHLVQTMLEPVVLAECPVVAEAVEVAESLEAVQETVARAETPERATAMSHRTELLIASVLLLTLAFPAAARAERWIMIGPDNVVMTVIENTGYPTENIPPKVWFLQDWPDSGAASGSTYKDGKFIPRPPMPSELLTERISSAIDSNKIYLAITTPTAAQATAQIKALTRQVNAMMRLQLQRFEDLSE